MHILSKVFLGLVIVLAVLAITLTSTLFKARGHWLDQLAQRETQLKNTTEDLRKKRLAVATAREEINRLMNQWGTAWPNAQGQIVNPQLGAIVVNVGGNAGLGRRELAAQQQLPAIYTFVQSPQGEGTFFQGEFRPTAIQGDQTAAQLTRPPYEGEVPSWPQGPLRIRETIPSNWRAIFAGLQSRTAEGLQDVQDQQARLKAVDELIAKSQEQLQRRLAQLEGNPKAVEGSSPEVVDGLVESLRKAESGRNDDLARLDDLRHEYDRKYRQLLSLLDENRRLEAELPQPGAASSAAGGEQAADARTQHATRR